MEREQRILDIARRLKPLNQVEGQRRIDRVVQDLERSGFVFKRVDPSKREPHISTI